MTPALSPQDFVAKWRHATLKERSAAQSHFNDLCALLGQPTPTEADPAGRWFTFEAGRQQDVRRQRVGRRLEDGPLRLGVQGPARRPG